MKIIDVRAIPLYGRNDDAGWEATLSGVVFLLVTTLCVVMQAGRSASPGARSAQAAFRRRPAERAAPPVGEKSTPERGGDPGPR